MFRVWGSFCFVLAGGPWFKAHYNKDAVVYVFVVCGPFLLSLPQSTNFPYLAETLTLRLKIAQKPYIVWSLGPKALKYESLEPKGKHPRFRPLSV